MKPVATGPRVRINIHGTRPTLLSGPVVCAELGISRWTLVKMLRAGAFRAVPIGNGRDGLRNLRIPTVDVEAYINRTIVRGKAGIQAALADRSELREAQA